MPARFFTIATFSQNSDDKMTCRDLQKNVRTQYAVSAPDEKSPEFPKLHRILRMPILMMIVSLLTACNLSGTFATPTPLAPATMLSVRVASMTPSPQPTTQATQTPIVPTETLIPATTTQPAALTQADSCEERPDAKAAQHTVAAMLDYDTKTVEIQHTIRYENRTDFALSEIALAAETNNTPDTLILMSVQQNGAQIPGTLDRNRLTVMLQETLQPGCAAELSLQYRLQIPQIASGARGFKGYFGYNQRQLNLGYWLLTVAPNVAGGWLINEPGNVGEQIVLEQADWDVTIQVINAPELQIAAPGTGETLGSNHWRYVHHAARDFTLSLSPEFIVRRQISQDGTQIELYMFSDATALRPDGIDPGNRALAEGSQAFDQFVSLFGAYPYERMLIVQGDFPDGLEFSGLVFVSTQWFVTYETGVDNYLTVITVHEVAHQWWYARVGNDAARAPWLDEALSTYSEYIYYEEFYPDFKEWWWSFRVSWYNPAGDVDSTIYEFNTIREYINAVYLRGVQMLHNLREDIGTEAFFDLLLRYAQRADGEIATPELFWSLLSPEQFTASQDTRDRFLREAITTGQ